MPTRSRTREPRRSGIWRAEQAEKGQPATVAYSPAAIDEELQPLGNDEAAWDSLFANSGITPLALWYEDVIERPQEAVERAADYVGVTLDPSTTVSVPQIRRQISSQRRAVGAEQHARSRRC